MISKLTLNPIIIRKFKLKWPQHIIWYLSAGQMPRPGVLSVARTILQCGDPVISLTSPPCTLPPAVCVPATLASLLVLEHLQLAPALAPLSCFLFSTCPLCHSPVGFPLLDFKSLFKWHVLWEGLRWHLIYGSHPALPIPFIWLLLFFVGIPTISNMLFILFIVWFEVWSFFLVHYCISGA